MARVATYECWCCGGRAVRRLDPNERARPRVPCQGWCPACGGGKCMADAGRVATENLGSTPTTATPAC